MGHLLKNKKSMHIMVNGSRSPIPQVERNNKQYNACDVNNDDRARQFQHITSQPVKRILHVVDKNILQNLPILQKDSGMDEDIYRLSVPCIQGQTVRHKVHNVEPIIVPYATNTILDRYNKVALCCDLIHINSIGFMNTIYRHIMFSTGSIIKNRKLKNI